MIIDIHGHYTTEPPALQQFRDRQLAGLADASRRPASADLGISEGMVLAAGPGGEEIYLLSPDSGAKPGQRVK